MPAVARPGPGPAKKEKERHSRESQGQPPPCLALRGADRELRQPVQSPGVSVEARGARRGAGAWRNARATDVRDQTRGGARTRRRIFQDVGCPKAKIAWEGEEKNNMVTKEESRNEIERHRRYETTQTHDDTKGEQKQQARRGNEGEGRTDGRLHTVCELEGTPLPTTAERYVSIFWFVAGKSVQAGRDFEGSIYGRHRG